jgi:hypothetical protein
MKCFIPVCNFHTNSLSLLFSHYRNGHGLAAAGSEVKCSYGNCPRIFHSFFRLKITSRASDSSALTFVRVIKIYRIKQEHSGDTFEVEEIIQDADQNGDGGYVFTDRSEDMDVEMKNLQITILKFL